jgi:hypothetical protein
LFKRLKVSFPTCSSCGLVPVLKIEGQFVDLESMSPFILALAFDLCVHCDLCDRLYLYSSKKLSALVPDPPRGARLTMSPLWFAADSR